MKIYPEAHGPTVWTKHAEQRCDKRHAPGFVVEKLERDALTVLGKHRGRCRVPIRIVRLRNGFWVAPTVQGHIVTVYYVSNEKIGSWVRQCLQNVEEGARLWRLPVERTDRERVTDELTKLWVLQA